MSELLSKYHLFYASPWQLEPSTFYIFLGLHLVLFCISCYFFKFHLTIYRRLKNLPTSKIRSAIQGYVELKGQGVLDTPLIAPLTEQRCVWWRYKIENLQGSGDKKRWVTIDKAESQTHFILEDNTGRCFISPNKAIIYPLTTRKWKGNTPRPNLSSKGFLSSGSSSEYRYQECVILAGFPLYVIGAYHTVNPQQNLPDAGSLIRQWKADYQALLNKYDTNDDGEIDLDEWQAVLRDADIEIEKQYAKTDGQKPINLVSHEGLTKDKPFIISAKGEAWVLKCSRFKAALAACIMMILLILNLWVMFNR